MKFTKKITQEFDAVSLKVRAGVRYWEDAEINGTPDETGELTPLRVGEDWCPVIDLATGQIKDWPAGVKADINFKTVDDNDFWLLNAAGEELAHIDGYVIDMMCPGGDGYGDYIIMTINEAGIIEDFEANLREFEEADED